MTAWIRIVWHWPLLKCCFSFENGNWDYLDSLKAWNSFHFSVLVSLMSQWDFPPNFFSVSYFWILNNQIGNGHPPLHLLPSAFVFFVFVFILSPPHFIHEEMKGQRSWMLLICIPAAFYSAEHPTDPRLPSFESIVSLCNAPPVMLYCPIKVLSNNS